MNPARILHVIPTLDQSGAEKQCALLAANLPKDRFEVRVAALDRGGPYEAELAAAGIPVEIVGKRGKLDPLAFRRLVGSIRAWRPDIVQTWLFAGNAYGRLAAWWAKAPRIVVSERCVDSWKSSGQLFLDRRLARLADRIVGNAAAVRRFYFEQGLPAERLRVIPNAVEDRPAPPPAFVAELRARLGVPPGGLLIGCVGRLASQKRVGDVIHMTDVLRMAELPVRTAIVGAGPRRADLERFAAGMELGGIVHFLGHRADAADLMHAFDVLVLASEFEGMPNVALEAMRAGLPVVATRIPGTDEVVLDGETGLLVPVGQPFELARAVNKLLGDPALRQRLGAAGRERVRTKFSVAQAVAAYAALYEELLALPPGKR